MFSASTIEKYEKMSLSTPSTEYPSNGIARISGPAPLPSIPLLTKLLKSYHDEWGNKTHKKLIQSLITVLESKPSGKEDVRLNTVFERITNYMNQDDSKDLKSQPISIRGDFFSLLLVFFRYHPQHLHLIKPDRMGIYALLILGVFAYNKRPYNYKRDGLRQLETVINLDDIRYFHKSSKWMISFLKKIIPTLSPSLLEEVVEGCIADSFNHFWLWPHRQPIDYYIYLQRMLINSGALTTRLHEKIADTFSGSNNNYFEFANRNLAYFSDFCSRLSDFSCTQQQEIFNTFFNTYNADDKLQRLDDYGLYDIINRISAAVSTMDNDLFHQSVHRIVEIYFTDYLANSNYVMIARSNLLAKIICRWMADEVIDQSIPEQWFKLLKKFENHNNPAVRLPVFKAYPAIARSAQANIYFNLDSQKKLLENIFFDCFNQMSLSYLREVFTMIAPDLYESSLVYLMARSGRLNQQEQHLAVLVTFTPIIKLRKLKLPQLSLDSIEKELSTVESDIPTLIVLSYIHLSIALGQSHLVNETIKDGIIKKLGELRTIYRYLSADESDLKTVVKYILDSMPAFFQILSAEQQQKLLDYLLNGYQLTNCHHSMAEMLIAIQRQFPQYADQIFNTMIIPTEQQVKHYNWDNDSNRLREDADKSLLPSMALLCSERVIFNLKEKCLPCEMLLLQLTPFPQVLISVIVAYFVTDDEFLLEEKQTYRLKLAREREKQELAYDDKDRPEEKNNSLPQETFVTEEDEKINPISLSTSIKGSSSIFIFDALKIEKKSEDAHSISAPSITTLLVSDSTAGSSSSSSLQQPATFHSSTMSASSSSDAKASCQQRREGFLVSFAKRQQQSIESPSPVVGPRIDVGMPV